MNSLISGKNNGERVCFSVNELVCNLLEQLEEAIHYATLEETYQVHRCFTGMTGSATPSTRFTPPWCTTKNDNQCCFSNVETPNHFTKEKVNNDVTCTDTVEFNYCKREKTTKNDGYGQKEVICTRTLKQDYYRKVIVSTYYLNYYFTSSCLGDARISPCLPLPCRGAELLL